MPELPEVETVVRELGGILPGHYVRKVKVFREDVLGEISAGDFGEAMRGSQFVEVKRRGKYLLFQLRGGGAGYLLAHLRMTGKFVWWKEDGGKGLEGGKHHRVWFLMERGGVLVFQDIRCFGRLRIGNSEADFPVLARLGVEPLSEAFEVDSLSKALANSGRSLKAFLLDQAMVAGLGNIYVCEACFRAGVSPLRLASSLDSSEVKKLHGAVRNVLQEAIAKNGTTISDFRRVDSKSGQFQNFLRVYGRSGYACRECEGKVLRVRQGQRSTFYCPHCQF